MQAAFSLKSKYIEALKPFSSNTNEEIIVAFVESRDDVPFWKNFFDKVIERTNPRPIVKVNVKTLSDDNSQAASGCDAIAKAVSNGTIQLGKNLIICLDSDYRYVLDNYSGNFFTIKDNPFSIETIVHSIENVLASHTNLSDYCLFCNCNSEDINYDVEKFITDWSITLYPTLVRLLTLIRTNHSQTDSISTELQNSLKLVIPYIENPQEYIKEFKNECEKISKKIEAIVTPSEINKTITILNDKNINENNCYLFYRGHDFFNHFASKVMAMHAQISLKEFKRRNQNNQRIGEFVNSRIDPVKGIYHSRTNHLDCEFFRLNIDKARNILT